MHPGTGLSAASIVALALALIVSGGVGLPPGVHASPARPATPAPTVSSSAPFPPSAPVVPASGGPQWVNLTPLENGTAPAASSDASLAYDPAASEWVYFGGCTVRTCAANETWVYSDGGWRNVTDPVRAPPGRYSASMDYDPNAGGVLLFGGVNGFGTAMNDTWLFQGGQWTNMSFLGPGPPPRYWASMTFEPEPGTNGSLLFGGCVGFGFGLSCMNDTWVWQPGVGWTALLNLTAPPVRGGAMMAYDPLGGYAVMYGGYGNCPSTTYCAYQDTWEFYSGTWWPLALRGSVPPARDSASMTFDRSLDGALMFGGFNETSLADLNETWLFSGGSWTDLTGVSAPVGRFASALSVDSSGVPPLLFGGFNSGGTLGDTWAFETPLSLVIARTPTAAEVGATVPIVASVAGGSAPYSVNADFGDGQGSAASGPGPAFDFLTTYPRAQNATLKIGVTDLVGDTLNATTFLTIVRGPTLVAAADVTTGDVGIPVMFSSHPGNGSGALSGYAWEFGDGANASGPNVTHTFTAAGQYPVEVNATDASGAPAGAQLTLTVVAAPSAAIQADPSSPVATTAVSLIATVTGGSPPLHYAWLLGDGTTAGAPSPSHVYATGGTYSVQLWVNDSAGGSSHASLSVIVTPAPSSSTSTGSSTPATIPSWYWIALAAIVVPTAAIAFLWIRRRQKIAP